MSEDRPAGTEALAEYIKARYGDRLDDSQREELCERIAEYREAGEELEAFGLENGDGPAFAFGAYRGE